MNTRFILRRLLTTIIVVFGITFIVFMIIQMVPGDPARVVLGVAASPENVEALRERLGLNEPILVQYGAWLTGLLQGDLGNSLVTGQPVTDQLLQRLPATLTLAGAGLVVGLIIGPSDPYPLTTRCSTLKSPITIVTVSPAFTWRSGLPKIM